MLDEQTEDGREITFAERYFTQPAPVREMPEHSRDPRVALSILESEMLLDGDPAKNLATFVTTFMEPEARYVIENNLHRNWIDHAEYPRTNEIANRCVRMLHHLFHGVECPEIPGTATAGSSEAVMLGALAMKWRWKAAREKAGKSTAKPNLVYGADVHVVWDKFCRYFDVEPRQVNLPRGRFTVGADDLQPQIDENTIGVVAVVGTTFTGECDDVAGIDAMLRHLQSTRGLEVPMHVDAASGGFVFPFSNPEFEWDFRLDTVSSINVSGHKFGLVYPGVGWLVFRDEHQLPEPLVFYEDYLGERDATFTLNFSGSSAFILAQYYNFVRFGRQGYASLVRAMDRNAAALSERLAAEDALELVGGEPRLPLVIARVRPDERFNGTDLVAELAQRRGWMVPAYQLPPDNDDQQILRILVKVNQSRELADALADDITDSIADLRRRAAGHHVPKRVHRGHAY
ncbi:glutamate decarboxylase [Conexibacter sp. JD483]|uniref:glutamate decarboxylase n=1 Tax=unclassified Conexibacter TaxID=2627773 RepID=UPI0027179975|nr:MULTISPECIES: glutamate decarboxylase [unclassified Conexibacter]MDO8186915.1 glutamate decarboxylase [Conexibacter sp. CPCC 205706]MDO8200773.1 glutamate decarboxylase [Conexibacter sp. CPCC 205762]MDR9371989.1 glutamate decarboxylase [Conexibacter sp. JD483]